MNSFVPAGKQPAKLFVDMLMDYTKIRNNLFKLII